MTATGAPVTTKWVVLGVVVAILAAIFVRLGFWQLDRAEQARVRNEVVAGRLASDPVPLEALIIPDVEQADEDLLGWPVVVEGRYLVAEEVLVRGRALDGTPGSWVVTPLERTDGNGVVVVNRGWVPLEVDAPGDPRVAPPTGVVTVRGVTIPDEEPTRFGPQDPADGRLEVVANLDLERLGAQVGADLGPVVVQKIGDSNETPTPLGAPDVEDAGPHVAYVVQWFGFAAVVVVGYAALVGRQLGRGPFARFGARRQADHPER